MARFCLFRHFKCASLQWGLLPLVRALASWMARLITPQSSLVVVGAWALKPRVVLLWQMGATRQQKRKEV
eukprot:s3036_g5.t1